MDQIKSLLDERANINARLLQMPYDGLPEVRSRENKKYLYVKKRVGDKVTAKYVGPFSNELYAFLINNNEDSKILHKNLREIEKQLRKLDFKEAELSESVAHNIDFARANMKLSIYEQAVLEGVSTTYVQTEEIIENGEISGMSTIDVQKVINLKRAWEFILNKDILSFPSDLAVACHIAGIINVGVINNGNRVRSLSVRIGGTSYIPPIPDIKEIEEQLNQIISKKQPAIDTAINLCLYVMRTQIFIDGNKRTAILLANHYLISHSGGLMVVPEKDVAEFKELLIDYYEKNNPDKIRKFLKENCWQKINK